MSRKSPSSRIVKLLLDSSGVLVAAIRWRKPTYGFGKLPTKDPCVYCGKPSKTWEHIYPLSKGGTWGWQNRARACVKCNSERGNTSFLVFMLKNHHQRGERILKGPQ